MNVSRNDCLYKINQAIVSSSHSTCGRLKNKTDDLVTVGIKNYPTERGMFFVS